MLFFQVLLLAGYAYADWSARRFPPGRQVAAQVALLALALLLLPIVPDASWKTQVGANPTGRILLLLSVVVGMPYFVLATSSPLLQAWFGRISSGSSPYRLYALSNAGSLLGLLSYPFVVEPLLPLRRQAELWSAGFGLYALGFAGCGVLLLRGERAGGQEASPAAAAGRPAASAPPLGDVLLWILLPACGSVLLLATTNQLCQDVAVVPLLWVLPLSLYLLSFIVCFASDRSYERAAFVPSTALCLAALAMLMTQEDLASLPFQIAVYCTTLFGCCMICHGELVRLKPPAERLTLFYLAVSFGGALGGAFVALVAPRLFDVYLELPIALVGTILLWLVAVARDPRSALHRGRPRWAWAALSALALVYAGVNARLAWLATDGYDSVDRNFYGVIRTYTEFDDAFGDDARVLLNGVVDHGFQFLSEENRRRPVSYYAAESGVGLAARLLRPDAKRRIGVLGLGAGALASYGRPGDEIRFYEINPLVVRLARQRFRYLEDCPAAWDVAAGDGRLSLERELAETGGLGRGYDLLVLDAFSGDAPPAHLLTREAFGLYLRHLAQDGVLAVNVSNSYVDLVPLVWRIAEELGAEPLLFETEEALERGTYEADWILLARNRDWRELPELWEASVEIDEAEFSGVRVWTDDYSNLFQLLIR
jgi:hypothetical protein